MSRHFKTIKVQNNLQHQANAQTSQIYAAPLCAMDTLPLVRPHAAACMQRGFSADTQEHKSHPSANTKGYFLMKHMLAAATIALTTLSAPAFAQPAETGHSARAQEIFDALRAEGRTSTSHNTSTIDGAETTRSGRAGEIFDSLRAEDRPTTTHDARSVDDAGTGRSQRVQHIFDQLRSEKGTGTTQ